MTTTNDTTTTPQYKGEQNLKLELLERPLQYLYLVDHNHEKSDVLLLNETITEDSFIVQHFDTKYYLCFSNFNNYWQTIQYLFEKCKNGDSAAGNFYDNEVILDRLQKPKFDIEAKSDINYNAILEAIVTAFKETYEIEPVLAVLDSSGATDHPKYAPYKFSRHVIISNCAFTNSKNARWFTNEVLKPRLTPEQAHDLDCGVNKPIQFFRTVFSVKEGRRLNGMKNLPISDYFITVTKDCHILEDKCPEKEEPKEAMIVVDDDVLKVALENLAKLYPGVYEPVDSFNNIITLRRQLPCYCNIHKREHDKDNAFLTVFPNVVKFYCRRSDNDDTKPWPFEVIWEVPRVIKDIKNTVFDDYLKFIGKPVNIDEFRAFVKQTITFIINGGRSLYVTKNIRRGEPDFTYIKPEELRKILPKITYKKLDGESTTVKMYTIIESMQNIIAKSRIDFIPYNTEYKHTDVFNEFLGFKQSICNDCEVTIIKLFMDHIRFIWCNNNEQYFNYVNSWFAHIIQRPNKKTGVAMLLKSMKQGAGKQILLDFIGKEVIGSRYYTTLNDVEQLVGKFNVSIEHKLLTICDEVSNYGGAYRSNDKLKNIITQPTIRIERKGIDNVEISDFNNYIFLTNNDWPVKVEAGDRRYFCLELNNEKAGDVEYFEELNASLTPSAAKCLFNYWASYDITNWSALRIPDTNLKTDLKLNSVSLPIKFLISIIMNSEADIHCHTNYLFIQFNQWMEEQHDKTNITLRQFSSEIIKVLGESRNVRIDKKQARGLNLTRNEIVTKLCSYLKLGEEYFKIEKVEANPMDNVDM